MNLRNRKLVRTVQIVLGLHLLFSVVSAYVQIFPVPEFSEAGGAFLGALFATGYILPLMQLVFVLSGLMFIFDKWSAFGVVLLAPITVNIILFHIFLDFSGFWIALVFTILNIYLLTIHWPRYKGMFGK
jgi:putative oxidoreductase